MRLHASTTTEESSVPCTFTRVDLDHFRHHVNLIYAVKRVENYLMYLTESLFAVMLEPYFLLDLAQTRFFKILKCLNLESLRINCQLAANQIGFLTQLAL